MARPFKGLLKKCCSCKKTLRISVSIAKRQKTFSCSEECRSSVPCKIYKGAYGYLYTRLNGKIVKYHRMIMESHLKRKLLKTECVHHINEDKLDNRIENLKVCSFREHFFIHKPSQWSKG